MVELLKDASDFYLQYIYTVVCFYVLYLYEYPNSLNNFFMYMQPYAAIINFVQGNICSFRLIYYLYVFIEYIFTFCKLCKWIFVSLVHIFCQIQKLKTDFVWVDKDYTQIWSQFLVNLLKRLS